MLSRRLLRIKTIKALYAHFKSGAADAAVSEKNLLHSIDRTYDLYLLLLDLLPQVARYAQSRIELGRRKKLPSFEDLHPNTRFVDNRMVRLLAEDEGLAARRAQRALGWEQSPELIKTLYANLCESDYYRSYMEGEGHVFRDDAKLAQRFYLNEIEDLPLMDTVLEERSIYWCDDVGFALGMVLRTLKACKATSQQVPLLPQFKNEDDLNFTLALFRGTLLHFDEYQKNIEAFTANWDVERIAFMDNLIMATAITELESCPSIPVKVTLDEYIEVAKYYSTPGSSVFINGVLDKIVESLTGEGRIVKTGRGLI